MRNSTRRGSAVATLALMIVLIGGCRTAPAPAPAAEESPLAPPARARPMVRTEMLLRRSRMGKEVVDDAAWERFVTEIIVPRFPDGFTVIDAQGLWRDATGTSSRERSKLLVILHERGDNSLQKIDEIRQEYERRFEQESVIRESAKVWVAF